MLQNRVLSNKHRRPKIRAFPTTTTIPFSCVYVCGNANYVSVSLLLEFGRSLSFLFYFLLLFIF